MRLSVTRPGKPEEDRRIARDHDPIAELAFMDGLRQGGLRLVDRNVAMRLVHKKVRDANFEGRKLLEMDALVAYAEMLMEVDVTRDTSVSRAREFHVRVKDLRDGAVVAAWATPVLHEDDRPVRYRATDKGYERYTVTPGPREMGLRLASEVLAQQSLHLQP
ncbi:MAG: hypothetical protein FJY37_06655 [Betaproteobacteria bacterium]|nr:hypothetical protein [Betaproteobacteria bacterium]